MRTKVGIIGAGPAGLTLALLLEQAGVECVILEDCSREHVERRARAGLMEQNTVDLMHELGAAERLGREALEHDGINLRCQGVTIRIAITELTGRHVTIYGQHEVLKDLVACALERGIDLRFEVSQTALHDLDTETPRLTFTDVGGTRDLECDFIAGCDGFTASAVPPFRMGSSLWEELQIRLGTEGWRVNEGEVFEKGITPMRSFVCEPMQYGRLFLAGDAAHIVPPTGAKGLNLAVNDARLLAAALVACCRDGSSEALERYTETALRRVWRAQDFSDYMTQLLHDLGHGPYDRRLQLARLDYLSRSEAAAKSLAENYAGLPAAPDF